MTSEDATSHHPHNPIRGAFIVTSTCPIVPVAHSCFCCFFCFFTYFLTHRRWLSACLSKPSAHFCSSSVLPPLLTISLFACHHCFASCAVGALTSQRSVFWTTSRSLINPVPTIFARSCPCHPPQLHDNSLNCQQRFTVYTRYKSLELWVNTNNTLSDLTIAREYY